MCALCTSIAHHPLSFTLQTMSEFKSSITKKHHCSISCTKMCIDNESNVWVVFTWNNICTIFFWFPSKVFEDVNLPDRPQLKTTLNILNYLFAAVFSMEFILKIIGLGTFKYFSSFWNCMDAFIVSVSLLKANDWEISSTDDFKVYLSIYIYIYIVIYILLYIYCYIYIVI